MEILIGIILLILAFYVIIFMVKVAFRIAILLVGLVIANYILSETLGVPNYFENLLKTYNTEEIKENGTATLLDS